MISKPWSRAWCHAVGPRLERGVRQSCGMSSEDAARGEERSEELELPDAGGGAPAPLHGLRSAATRMLFMEFSLVFTKSLKTRGG